MHVIFQCYGGTHSSVICAFIYTGRLPRHRTPAAWELNLLPYFDRLTGKDMGMLHFAGRDAGGNPVFILGCGRWGAEVRKLIASFLNLSPAAAVPAVAVVNCLPLITPYMRLGGFLSRQAGMTRLGRFMVCQAVRSNYRRYVEQVLHFEKNPESYLI